MQTIEILDIKNIFWVKFIIKAIKTFLIRNEQFLIESTIYKNG